MNSSNLKADAVFQGGGVKGIALIGAASVITGAGYSFQNLAGTSAGAIVAVLLAAGYTPDELKTILMELDFRSFQDRASWLGRVPGIGKYLDLLSGLGMYGGTGLLELLRRLLLAKGVKTFGDLVFPGESEPRYRFKVHVVASDISRGRMVILPDDAPAYGIQPEDLEVALAVRMSMSIPYYFRPAVLKNPAGMPCYVVDGGLLSNFPIEFFDTPPPAVPAWPTFGFTLVPGKDDPEEDNRVEYEIHGPLSMFRAMFNTAMVAHDSYSLQQPDVAARTIRIDHLGISATAFDLSLEQKEALWESGRAAARGFLAEWDFAGYISRFRTGDRRGRRDASLALPSSKTHSLDDGVAAAPEATS
jgi:NTE family protein